MTEPKLPPPPPSQPPSQRLIRLQRALAMAGIDSRRHCEDLIRQGRVSIDGTTVTAMGIKVAPETQDIRVDGQPIRRRRHVYYMLNKPVGVLSTSYDQSGRVRAIDLIGRSERVYTVGRLDKSTEGLILITNDGDLANQLTHPRYGVEKTYLVRVVGRPAREHLDRLLSGVHLAEGVARAASVRLKKQLQRCTDLELVLREGRNREVRRVMAAVGHKVVQLKRIAIGPIRLGELPSGAHRELTADEVARLREVVQAPHSKPGRKRTPRIDALRDRLGARPRRGTANEKAAGPAERGRRGQRSAGRGGRASRTNSKLRGPRRAGPNANLNRGGKKRRFRKGR
jgi:23S rRNA pseudouridine2605 synthase